MSNVRRRAGALPPVLREIVQAIGANPGEDSNIGGLREGWAQHIARVRADLPQAVIEDDGEVLYLGAISPGCQACKAGTWDCVFVGMKCNLSCPFCYSPTSLPDAYAGSPFGGTLPDIVRGHARTTITGVSFSGGEPFLYRDRFFDWVARVRAASPDMYLWAYTNGVLADEDSLRCLGGLGLQEIRFNCAATGYTDLVVMRNLEHAARHLPAVTVEVPAVPDHADQLLAALRQWMECGVRFLNLHELIYETGTLSASLPGERCEIRFEDGHRSAFDPRSRLLTHRAMCEVASRGLRLAVNDCSMQSKIRQIRGRRRALAPIARQPFEELVGDARLESTCVVRSQSDWFFCRPEEAETARSGSPGCRVFRLQREAPLFPAATPRWLLCEESKG